jgi:high-affinity nickel-transport protein
MRLHLKNFFNDEPEGLRERILGIYFILTVLNLGAWFWAIVAFHGFPLLLGTALLAYSLGLRHAVDADHIAAIDNVTRNLMQSGKRPAAVGLMFSLGHSSVVLVGAAAIAGTTLTLQHRWSALKAVGGGFTRLPTPVAYATRYSFGWAGLDGVTSRPVVACTMIGSIAVAVRA